MSSHEHQLRVLPGRASLLTYPRLRRPCASRGQSKYPLALAPTTYPHLQADRSAHRERRIDAHPLQAMTYQSALRLGHQIQPQIHHCANQSLDLVDAK